MKLTYADVVPGLFIKRINRFIARVLVDGEECLVHVKNTGRCGELFIPGARIFLEKARAASQRKTRYSLIGVYKGTRLINVDSQVPPLVVQEGLASGRIAEINHVTAIRKEVPFGSSRFDLFFRQDQLAGFIEVKGVTLEEGGCATFPDAPTKRGTKHVYEMINAVREGYAGFIFFLVQMRGVKYFKPNETMDAEFSHALRAAEKDGVQILAYEAAVRPNEIVLTEQVPVQL